MIRTVPRPRWPDLLTDVVRWLLSPKLDSLGASRRAPACATPAGAGVGNREPARAGALDGHNAPFVRLGSGSINDCEPATSSAPAPAPPANGRRPGSHLHDDHRRIRRPRSRATVQVRYDLGTRAVRDQRTKTSSNRTAVTAVSLANTGRPPVAIVRTPVSRGIDRTEHSRW